MASSQPSTFPPIPFSATFPQQSFRLLELTPELVEIIESQRRTSSKRRKLWFKSSASGASTTTTTGRTSNGTSQPQGKGKGAEREGFLHLCSGEKIWAAKQVSTSNSVYVTRTMSAEEAQKLEAERRDRDGDGDTAMDEGDQQVNGDHEMGDLDKVAGIGGLTAISQVKNILELIEVKPDESDVERMLRDVVPIFSDIDIEDGRHSASNPHTHLSTEDLFDNIPFPTNIISAQMQRLFVFGHKPSSTRAESKSPVPQMFLPSTNLLLKAWTQFTTQCTISEVNLDRDGGLNYHSLYEVLVEVGESCINQSEKEVTLNVIMAILRRIANHDDGADLEDPVFYVEPELNGRPFADAVVPGTTARISLDPSITRELVGRWLLANLRTDLTPLSELRLDNNGTLTVKDFLDVWTKLIPDSWARDCDVHALVASAEGWEFGRNGEAKEVLRSFPDQRTSSSVAVQAEAAKAQPRKQGKWHEKFGAQRSAAAKK